MSLIYIRQSVALCLTLLRKVLGDCNLDFSGFQRSNNIYIRRNDGKAGIY